MALRAGRDLPLDNKVLGGLFGRDVFASRNTYRYRFFWSFSSDEQPVPMP